MYSLLYPGLWRSPIVAIDVEESAGVKIEVGIVARPPLIQEGLDAFPATEAPGGKLEVDTSETPYIVG